MEQPSIDQLIINKPYEEPKEYWKYNRDIREFSRTKGRRPAGYLIASGDSKTFDDPGAFVEIPLVNRIRLRVEAWRNAGYPGVTAITKRLLEYWRDPRSSKAGDSSSVNLKPLKHSYGWLKPPNSEKTGIEIPGDGGDFPRLCAKMATGTGKTIVMAMVIAWNILNKTAYPEDTRFAKNYTHRRTRTHHQKPTPPSSNRHILKNYYQAFRIVPSHLSENLRKGKVIIRNWHTLNWETDEQIDKKRSVDKRGAKSDEAYVRDVLQEMASTRNLLVINDEAHHHAWRVPAQSKIEGVTKTDLDEATKWVGGLDRIHRTRGILTCYDFSATPFTPFRQEKLRGSPLRLDSKRLRTQ